MSDDFVVHGRDLFRSIEALVQEAGLAVDRAVLLQLTPDIVGGDDFCANTIPE